jgi:hypothetical protein
MFQHIKTYMKLVIAYLIKYPHPYDITSFAQTSSQHLFSVGYIYIFANFTINTIVCHYISLGIYIYHISHYVPYFSCLNHLKSHIFATSIGRSVDPSGALRRSPGPGSAGLGRGRQLLLLRWVGKLAAGLGWRMGCKRTMGRTLCLYVYNEI